jgi:hypothetical protein
VKRAKRRRARADALLWAAEVLESDTEDESFSTDAEVVAYMREVVRRLVRELKRRAVDH